MTFSFNFQIDSEHCDGAAKSEAKGENGEDSQTVDWIEAKEHFVNEVHRQKATRPENVETLKIGEESLHYISSESVSLGLRNSDYSGDLEPALLDNTDLVPGKYEVRRIALLF